MLYQISCPCLFGLESVLSDEIRAIGGEELSVSDGRVTFVGDARMIAKANLWLRTAERVQLLVGTYRAETFEQLFDGMASLPLELYHAREGHQKRQFTYPFAPLRQGDNKELALWRRLGKFA